MSITAWNVLSDDMLLENKGGAEVFLAERISPPHLEAMYRAGRAVLRRRDWRIIAFAALWETERPDWMELGSFWVHPAYRGAHLGSTLYDERLALIPEGTHGFVVSHNERAVHLALTHGFTEATRDSWQALAPYDLVCGVCDRDVKDRRTCPHRAVPTECRLLVR